MRRRRRDFVINIPPHAIPAHNFESGGMGILAVLNHPHPATCIKIQKQGLFDERIGKYQIDRQTITRHQRFDSFLRWQRARRPRDRFGRILCHCFRT